MYSNVTSWMNQQYMKVNPDKNETILFFPKSQVIRSGGHQKYNHWKGLYKILQRITKWWSLARWNLNGRQACQEHNWHSYKLLRHIGKSILTNKHTEILVHAVISRLDYYNSWFVNISKRNIFELQKVQKAVARQVVGERRIAQLYLCWMSCIG